MWVEFEKTHNPSHPLSSLPQWENNVKVFVLFKKPQAEEIEIRQKSSQRNFVTTLKGKNKMLNMLATDIFSICEFSN